MTAPSYFALPMGSGDAAIVAVWPDGKLAINLRPQNIGQDFWQPILSPNRESLWPSPAPVVPPTIADQAEFRPCAVVEDLGSRMIPCGFPAEDGSNFCRNHRLPGARGAS